MRSRARVVVDYEIDRKPGESPEGAEARHVRDLQPEAVQRALRQYRDRDPMIVGLCYGTTSRVRRRPKPLKGPGTAQGLHAQVAECIDRLFERYLVLTFYLQVEVEVGHVEKPRKDLADIVRESGRLD